MKHRESKRSEGKDSTRSVTEVLKGGVLAGVVTVGLLLLWAVLVAGGVIGERWMDTAVLVSCALGSAAGGLWVGRKIPSGRWLVGACVGGELFLILFSAGTAIYGGTALEQESAKILSSCLGGGVMASLLCKNKKKKGGRRERRKNKV